MIERPKRRREATGRRRIKWKVSTVPCRTVAWAFEKIEQPGTASAHEGRLEIFAAGVIANVAWNAICSRDVGFSFDDSRYPRYTCPWQIARETVRINCLRQRRRRLHTQRHSVTRASAWRRTTGRKRRAFDSPFFRRWPPIRSCEYLVTVNYTRYRFIFSWQIRATIPWVLSPGSPRVHLRHPASSPAHFNTSSSLFARRSSV